MHHNYWACSLEPVLWHKNCCSLAQLCPTLYNPIDCRTPGFPVHHQLPELTQTHVHWVGDAIQPSHPLSSPSPSAFSLSQHQGLFQRVSSSHQVAKILELHIEYWSSILNSSISPSIKYSKLISFRIDWFDHLAVQGTLKYLLQHTVQKHQFFGAQPSLWSNYHICTWLLEKA